MIYSASMEKFSQMENRSDLLFISPTSVHRNDYSHWTRKVGLIKVMQPRTVITSSNLSLYYIHYTTDSTRTLFRSKHTKDTHISPSRAIGGQLWRNFGEYWSRYFESALWFNCCYIKIERKLIGVKSNINDNIWQQNVNLWHKYVWIKHHSTKYIYIHVLSKYKHIAIWTFCKKKKKND